MDDYSINSYVFSKQKTSKDDDQIEESGWTAYFEDFSNNYHHQQQNSYCSSFSCGSSLISDAATTRGAAAWKASHDNIDHHHNHHVFPKKLRFKKTRTKEICDEDDSLEDTASSPVNSPKVSDDLKSNDMNPRRRADEAHSSLGKGIAPGNCSDVQMEEESKLNLHDGKINDCTELKKRGLCLVPFSMLVNHLG